MYFELNSRFYVLLVSSRYLFSLRGKLQVLHYGYIDESGTKSDQKYMTIALVVFQGRRSAERLQLKVLQELDPRRFHKIKSKSIRSSFEIHYTDMDSSERAIVGRLFGEANISCFISYYQYSCPIGHDERFDIYCKLVRLVIINAFDFYKELEIIIAKQGGWQTYHQSFLRNLKTLSRIFIERGEFRRVKYELASSSIFGIQVADYYAGAFREYLRFGQSSKLKSGYEYVCHQIKIAKVYE